MIFDAAIARWQIRAGESVRAGGYDPDDPTGLYRPFQGPACPNALPREVTTQLDIELEASPLGSVSGGEPRIAIRVPVKRTGKLSFHAFPKDPKVETIWFVKGPRDPKEGGYCLTFEDGTRIHFDKDATVQGATFKTGTELVKRNGWWCRTD